MNAKSKIFKIVVLVVMMVYAILGCSNVYAQDKKSIKGLDVNVDTSIHTYTGNERKASVQIYDGTKKLKRNKDYKVTYKYTINPGRAQVIIKGIGNYEGQIKKYYYIAPAKTKVTDVSFNSKFTSATISWEKVNNASGYKVYMAESKYGEYKRIKTIEGKNSTSYKKSGLDPNKMYYFKVRAYKQYKNKQICKKYSNAKAGTGLVSNVSLNSISSGANRNWNLYLACKTISGTILEPGETFNWFNVVGQASASKGYKPAGIYLGSETVQGYGGGVCQVSSTLYQAARNMGLQIVERHGHGKPVSYTTLGNDATVYYGVYNLRIRNNKGYRVKIVMSAYRGQTTCKLYRVL